jgi:cell division protein FtsN
MMENEKDSGHELVLDNRKLIIAFTILIAICGSFFVIGFLEGKRQGYQEGFHAAVETGPTVTSPGFQAQMPEGERTEPESPGALTSDMTETRLDWYRSVNRRDDEPETPQVLPAAAAETAKKPAPQIQKEQPRVSTTDADVSSGSYSVQVGAFRARREAEVAARELQSRGFDSRIELPESPDGLHLVKVGSFGSRAEAVVMQRRLNESGFSTFIKTN